ncbi:HlyD family type I secretion periplasmic adaptor subunit [Rhizobium sp. BK176]|uniref:HlyD family type I secretion periplasmic adaptor subunit n=1 Tax=Rhizobium sp. BK176 TaxID=2587071 RepID=UPI002169A303|nr:HlyD family type I secretion periplasmic adaptor subunit [Rhizobium sp. BK176]MCS4089859.1 HlyD family type I secretion membrane fusion protein [Rhizobium sp. BK176]
MTRKNDPRGFVIAGYATIFMTFVVGGTWACLAKVDEAVIAPGHIDVASNKKVIQHLEGGIVKEIAVKDGSAVKKGDLLIRLERQSSVSNLEVLRQRVARLRADEYRLINERDLSTSLEYPRDLLDQSFPGSIDENERIFRERRNVLDTQVEILASQIEQLEKQQAVITGERRSFEARVAVLGAQLDRLRVGKAKGIIQANVVSVREDEFLETKANVERLDGEYAKTQKGISEKTLQKLLASKQYTERAANELKDVRDKLQEAIQSLKVAEDTEDRNAIRAPSDGFVQNLAVHTVGGVVQPAQALMEIVPDRDALVVKARVAPNDIDNVTAGLKAEIRFSSIPGRFVPIIEETVEDVSKGVTAQQGQQGQEAFYTARIDLNRSHLPKSVQDRLSVDIPVEVMISKGERTVLEFLTSPLSDAIRKSMREE